MSHGEQPLLARQASSTSSRDIDEEDALLTGRPIKKNNDRQRKWREIGAWVWAAVSTIVVVILAVAFSQEKALAAKRKEGNCGTDKQQSGKRNLVFMVSDGMGPASLELARTYRQYTENLPWDDVLTLDEHLIGQHRTRSSDSVITDSAAGATAFSCGYKSYNGAIGVFPDQTPCGTVLEAAKKAGYMTGLVVTTRLTDATPACFGAHVQTRAYEDLIAEHLLGHYPLGRMVDLMIGGGRCHFLPNTTEGSCRADDKDLLAMAEKDGWEYVDNKKDLMNLDPKGGVKLPLLALMADGDMPYEIDRRHIDEIYPSQLEMAKFALNVLKAATADKDKGFFIMIEGSRIDLAGHDNDPATQAHETLIHDKTFKAVLEFLEDDETPGVAVSTSDHETGGLSDARQLTPAYPDYIWLPGVLANATYSGAQVGFQWITYLTSEDGQQANIREKSAFVKKLIRDGMGFVPTDEEIKSVVETSPRLVPPKHLFADMISRRAEIGWSTHGHSGVDVNVYGSDPAFMSAIVGNHENIEVGRFLADYLDVDVRAVTKELQGKHVITKPGSTEQVLGHHDTSVTVEEEGEWEYAWTGPKLSSDMVGVVDAKDEYHSRRQ